MIVITLKELVKNGAKLRLTAVSDNTIPLDVLELIANKLNAYYFHLGTDFEAMSESLGYDIFENEEIDEDNEQWESYEDGR